MKSLLLFLLLLVPLVCMADKPEVPDDEEDPYFLLCGQADQAIKDMKYEDAVARLMEAMSIRPNSPENILLLSNLGMVYSYLDRDSLALATLDEAHRRAPAMSTILSNRGRVLLKMGRDKDAYADFSAVVEADSLNTDARFYRGTMALYSGNLELAEKDFEVLKTQKPDAMSTAQALSSLYFLTGRDKEAIPYLKNIISVDPAPEYYASLAGCYLATSNLTEASATLAEAFEKYPSDPELYYYRAMLNRDRYRMDDAHRDASKAIKLGLSPRKAKALFEK